MADRPILFSAPMTVALRAGRKTQTRRLVPAAMQDAYYEYDDWCRAVSGGVPSTRQWEAEYYLERTRIRIGDRLWVKEAYRLGRHLDDVAPRDCSPSHIWYEADGSCLINGNAAPIDHIQDLPGKLRPSMFMRREFSRTTLLVTDVRVQRLQDISEGDAAAEGAYRGRASGRFADDYCTMALAGRWFASARGWYADLWNRINGPGSWEANPWVVAYSFRVIAQNIDQVAA